MKKGFTLIELLVVIAIVGVLSAAAIAIINPSFQLKKSRDTKRKADLAQFQAAFELYRADQGAYPASLPVCPAPLTAAGTTYLKSTPCDPKSSDGMYYTYIPSGSPASAYTLIACLENTSDGQKDIANSSPPCSNGGAINWSYTVTNP